MQGKRARVDRRVLTVLAVAIVILAIGFATYFSGGIGKKEKAPATSKVSFDLAGVPDPLPMSVESTLALPYGPSGLEIARVGLSTLEAAFTDSAGRILVVDHEKRRPGARVRAYASGRLVYTHDAPPGSALFAAVGDGFGYVIAKGQSDSEQLVVVGAKGSVEATYVVPLRLNSGAVFENRGTLYVVARSGFVDPDTNEVTGEDVLVPVAVNGVQQTDQQAEDGVQDSWRPSTASGKWRHKLRTTPRPQSVDETEQLLLNGSSRIVIPYEAVPLGVDTRGAALVFLPPHKLVERAVAGWPALTDQYALLASIASNGAVVGAMPLRVPEGAYFPDIGWARRIGFDGSRVTVVDKTARGALITVWEVSR